MMKWYMHPSHETQIGEVAKTATIDEFYHFFSDLTETPYLIMHSPTTLVVGALMGAITHALSGGQNYSPVDNYIRNNFGSREVFPKYLAYIKDPAQNYKEVLMFNEEAFYPAVASVFMNNRYKYEKYLNILELEYNPIWNVDSNEVATEDRGGRSETDVKGGYTTDYHYDEDETKFYKAPETTENKYNKGGNRVTTSIKTGSETIERFNTQMNDLNYKAHDKETRTPSSLTDTVTEPTYINESRTYRDDPNHLDDISTRHDRDDSETRSSQTNSHTAQSYQDKTTIVRQGNIGTKTTQSMIEEEKEVAKFYLMKEVAKDIVNAISFGVYY